MMTQASGSVGGMTASRNRGGNYMRARAIPTNPNTPNQIAVRALMSSLTSIWSSILTAAQRAAWETYAANVPLTNPLGDQIIVTGLNMYIRTNVPAAQVGLTRIDAAPTTFNLGSLTPISLGTLNTPPGVANINFDNTDEWATVTGGYLLIQSSIDVSPSINYFTGPYRQTAGIAGDTATPPTSPTGVSVVYPMVSGNKTFFNARSLTADGRLSAVQQVSAIVP